MSDYTPTTQEIREVWALARGAGSGYGEMLPSNRMEFNRWLAEVKAEAWQEGFDRGVLFFNSGDERNPYKQKEEQ